jgi:predicted MPP superfamily phosphohydrolase
LHFHPFVPDFFVRNLIAKVKALNPDLIVFTGDFICQSTLLKKNKLKDLLCSFSAPLGCFAVLGNHDYQHPVSINSEGEYDIMQHSSSAISKGFIRLFSTVKLAKRTTERARAVEGHQELIDLIRETPFALLDNESKKVAVKGSYLNICGLGEYTLAKCLPSKAFEEYDANFPGIILTHNPDSIPLLKNFPGDIIVCGHTHGGQINLPWIWKKLTLLENMQYKKGLFRQQDKWIYVSRGLGSVLSFRWFAPPEIVSITLE